MTFGKVLRWAGLGLVFVWFFVGGLGHFLVTDTFTSVVPGWVPFPRLVVLVTGVFEVLGALALLLPGLRRWVGIGMMVFCVCVTPVHIDMLRDADSSALGLPVLWGRLLFQPVLIWIIWMVTKPRSPEVAG